MKRSAEIGAADPTGATGAVAHEGAMLEVEAVVQTESRLVQRMLVLPPGSRVADAIAALSEMFDAGQLRLGNGAGHGGTGHNCKVGGSGRRGGGIRRRSMGMQRV